MTPRKSRLAVAVLFLSLMASGCAVQDAYKNYNAPEIMAVVLAE